MTVTTGTLERTASICPGTGVAAVERRGTAIAQGGAAAAQGGAARGSAAVRRRGSAVRHGAVRPWRTEYLTPLARFTQGGTVFKAYISLSSDLLYVTGTLTVDVTRCAASIACCSLAGRAAWVR